MMNTKCLFFLALASVLFIECSADPSNIQPLHPSQNSITLQKVDGDAVSDETIIAAYFKNFEALSKSESWEEIIAQGLRAIEASKKSNRSADEARICAQLTSTAFYMGDYKQALTYATCCHTLAEKFDDPSLFIRSLYLESAIYRALAPKEENEEAQQATFARAVEICEAAASLYSKKHIDNVNLKGKVYFNLGAAYADNPKGDLVRAENCYITALECFKESNAADDIIRITMRLGKVYLLQNDFAGCQRMIDAVRTLISSERLSMHADYLEAQLKFATGDFEEASKIATMGVEKAKNLKAREDESRLMALLQKIEHVQN